MDYISVLHNWYYAKEVVLSGLGPLLWPVPVTAAVTVAEIKSLPAHEGFFFLKDFQFLPFVEVYILKVWNMNVCVWGN